MIVQSYPDLMICSNNCCQAGSVTGCGDLCPHSTPHYRFTVDGNNSCDLPCPIAGYRKDATCKKLKLRNRYQILKESVK
jgi:hypothetical protein